MTTTLTTSYATLSAALDQAKTAVSTRPVLPVLRHALLSPGADDGQPTLRATDLELAVDITLEPAQANGPDALLPVAELVKALRGIRGTTSKAKAASETVTLTRDGDKITVSAFDRILTIDGWGPDVADFPASPKVSDDATLVAEMDAADLVAALTFADTARGRDDTLPILTGIRVEGAPDGTLTFAATDRYRLTVTEAKGSTTEWAALIPGDTVPAIKALTGTVRVRRYGNEYNGHLSLSTSTVVLDVRLLDGNFPPFRQLIPSEGLHTWRLDRALLLEDVLVAGSTVDKNGPITVTFGEHTFTVQGCREHDAHSDSDSAFRSGFNPRYLAAGLKAFKSTGVEIRATAAVKPYVITGQRPDGADGTYLIMPVRLPAEAEVAA